MARAATSPAPSAPDAPAFYSCAQCGSKFPSLQALGGHKSAHSPKRKGHREGSHASKRQKRPSLDDAHPGHPGPSPSVAEYSVPALQPALMCPPWAPFLAASHPTWPIAPSWNFPAHGWPAFAHGMTVDPWSRHVAALTGAVAAPAHMVPPKMGPPGQGIASPTESQLMGHFGEALWGSLAPWNGFHGMSAAAAKQPAQPVHVAAAEHQTISRTALAQESRLRREGLPRGEGSGALFTRQGSGAGASPAAVNSEIKEESLAGGEASLDSGSSVPLSSSGASTESLDASLAAQTGTSDICNSPEWARLLLENAAMKLRMMSHKGGSAQIWKDRLARAGSETPSSSSGALPALQQQSPTTASPPESPAVARMGQAETGGVSAADEPSELTASSSGDVNFVANMLGAAITTSETCQAVQEDVEPTQASATCSSFKTHSQSVWRPWKPQEVVRQGLSSLDLTLKLGF